MASRHLLDQALAEMAENPEQIEAVRESGHCIVLAGPGSGKTKTLTTAMARALLEDVLEPRGVACLTYNNECAIELESRLSRLGIRPSHRVFIGTVHSFAMSQVIAPYARCAAPELADDFKVASVAQLRATVEEAYYASLNQGENPHQRWRFAEEKRRRDVDRTSPDWNGRNPELARFIEEYERRLRAKGLIDFDDMPLLAFRMIQQFPWIKDALKAKFPTLFVDEYQDLGHALHELVLKLCFEGGIRLFGVGDTDQSIYGFAGANPELLAQLSNRPDVRTVRLRFNYRSGSQIIKASMAALGEDRDYVPRSGAPNGSIIFRALDGDIHSQADQIMTTVVPEIVASGISLDEIGVLYKNADQGSALATAAAKAGLPVSRADNQALVRRNSRLSRFVESCARWVMGGWKVADPPFQKLAHQATALVFGSYFSEEERLQVQTELIGFLDASKDRGWVANDWLTAFRNDVLSSWKARSRTAEDDWASIDEMISRTLPGERDADLSLAALAGNVTANGRLNLSTLHSAKGREFDVAVIFGANRDEMPDWRDANNPSKLREARRLFYVGVTRPRLNLYVAFRKGAHSPWVKELHDRMASS